MPSAIAPVVSLADGRAVTTSQDVAELFGREHKDVLEAIRRIVADVPPQFAERNFPPMVVPTQIGSGATRNFPGYRLTRDGFTLLAMGFTGKRALQFKLAYIEAFNRMEVALHALEMPQEFAIPPPKEFVRTQVVMSGELHRKLKVKAITQGSTIKQLMIAAAEDATRDFDLHRALENRS